MAIKKELYRDLKTQLDDIVEQMQSPDVDIERSLELYKEGQGLIKKLDAHLKQTKIEVEKISKLA